MNYTYPRGYNYQVELFYSVRKDSSADKDVWIEKSKFLGGSGIVIADNRRWLPLEDTRVHGMSRVAACHHIEKILAATLPDDTFEVEDYTLLKIQGSVDHLWYKRYGVDQVMIGSPRGKYKGMALYNLDNPDNPRELIWELILDVSQSFEQVLKS